MNRLKFLFVCSLLFVFFLIYFSSKRNIKQISSVSILHHCRTVILLTMCADSDEKIMMYKNVLTHWLKSSNFVIYTVDSSGSNAFSSSTNSRWIPFSFQQDSSKKDTSSLEIDSILKAYESFKVQWNSVDLVFKVTGKYFLPDLELVTKYVSEDTNLILQHTHKVFPFIGTFHQNSEIFGIKPILIPNFAKHFRTRKNWYNWYIENSLASYVIPGTYRLPRLEVSPLTKYPRRSGNILYWL